MSGTIKAIETEYNGYKFRSRLEARWAVFFDALGVEYVYEPEGYEFEDGTKYLPDFKIYVRHRSYTDEWEPVYVEVKGVMSNADMHKIEKLSEHVPVLILGNLPKDNDEYLDMFFDKEIYGFHSYRYMDDDEYPALFAIYEGEPWITGVNHDEWDLGESMDKALTKARQARFEHGEKPSV